MSRLHFSNQLSILGICAGVAVALGLAAIVLSMGGHLSPILQVVVIVLGLLAGGVVAAIAVVVGITIPTAVDDGKVDLGEIARGCCEPRGAEGDESSG